MMIRVETKKTSVVIRYSYDPESGTFTMTGPVLAELIRRSREVSP